MSKKQKLAYLCGPMEYSIDEGLGWRRNFSEVLNNKLKIKCIIPNDEEKKIKEENNMIELKKNNLNKYIKIIREFIQMDLNFVETADMLIVRWEGEITTGTVHEVGKAYEIGTPCYLVSSKELYDVPGWFLACFTKTFKTLDELIEYLEEMTNNEKFKVFEKHLKMIKNKSILEFTKFALLNVPDYFWTLMASTTNRRHGKNETLIDHIQGCLNLAEAVIDQFNNHWTDNQKDQLISAVILHDGWRCGEPGKERRFTQKDIYEKKYSLELLGKIRTSKDHPEVGFKQLLSLSSEFNILATQNKTSQICTEDLLPILNAVRYHYGPWTKTSLEESFNLSWPFDSIVVQVHNIDYMQAKTASMLIRS